VLFAVFASLFLYYVFPGVGQRFRPAIDARAEQSEGVDAAPAASALRNEQAAYFAHAAQKVRPAVIRVDAVHVPQTADQGLADAPREEAAGSIQVSRGCGLVIDPQGFAVTSRRVVVGAELVRIYLTPRSVGLAAQVAGSDAGTDLAVLKFAPPADLPIAAFAEAGRLEAGDCVMVVGNAYIPGDFIFVGLVDASGRRASPASLCLDDCIRTAAVNSWNCGGPLLNLQGEIVGLATSLGEFEGHGEGLAVPAFTVRRVIDELRSRGRVDRGWLGVFVHKAVLAEDGQPPEAIALAVDYVVPGSPASRGGIRAGDLIVRFGRSFIESPRAFRRRIAEATLGRPVAVIVSREGALRELRVTIEATPAVSPALPGEREWGIRLVGSTSPGELKFHGLGNEPGVVVDEVMPGRQARGLSRGDVILAINGIATPTLADFCREASRVLETSAEQTMNLEILSEGVRRVVPIEPAR
jgi:serine protease Do